MMLGRLSFPFGRSEFSGGELLNFQGLSIEHIHFWGQEILVTHTPVTWGGPLPVINGVKQLLQVGL